MNSHDDDIWTIRRCFAYNPSESVLLHSDSRRSLFGDTRKRNDNSQSVPIAEE